MTGIKRFLEIATFPVTVAVDSCADMAYHFHIRSNVPVLAIVGRTVFYQRACGP